MSLEVRNVNLPGIWALSANTNIPSTPTQGVSYRDPTPGKVDFENGQQYFEVYDSARLNALYYALSMLCNDAERFGFVRWSPLTDYVGGASIAMGSDGVPYRAIQNSGPNESGPKNPVSEANYWQTLAEYIITSGGGGGDTFPAGYISLMPFRYNALPVGWYFCNGERYATGTPQATVLSNLPTTYKTDFSITTNSSGTNVPTFFSGSNGYFLRPVNGTSRLPGSSETDAMRQITASSTVSGGLKVTATGSFTAYYKTPGTASGVFTAGTNTAAWTGGDGASGEKVVRNQTYNLSINTTATSPTISTTITQTGTVASENRPMNIGMTPAIYLGV